MVKRKQVLRLWKTGAAKRTCKDSLLARNKEVLLEQLDYSLHVVQRILGREHLILPQLVALSPRDAEHLRLSVRALRPVESRREKELIPGNVYGILADDCAFMGSRPSSGPSWCVEIKAKQGVLPPDWQEPLCRFCLHQHMKMRKKKLEYMSPYCPFDLFSGCPWRTKEAVYGLLSSPQNNLKIFRVSDSKGYGAVRKANRFDAFFYFFSRTGREVDIRRRTTPVVAFEGGPGSLVPFGFLVSRVSPREARRVGEEKRKKEVRDAGEGKRGPRRAESRCSAKDIDGGEYGTAAEKGHLHRGRLASRCEGRPGFRDAFRAGFVDRKNGNGIVRADLHASGSESAEHEGILARWIFLFRRVVGFVRALLVFLGRKRRERGEIVYPRFPPKDRAPLARRKTVAGRGERFYGLGLPEGDVGRLRLSRGYPMQNWEDGQIVRRWGMAAIPDAVSLFGGGHSYRSATPLGYSNEEEAGVQPCQKLIPGMVWGQKGQGEP
ncbi:unnamed protein product [Darwinula stevensoni]|uniref:Inositol-pentakisphosphate 2-kinase n=1 Tax=Darwinula stevensoni TaxID=69355 RepID=A0A7R9A326_9CRUS|nr:unnamed protein product [Darwinula stevensoni]CAG0881204.1 unnamed protein product [Darwinula stevensoni]